MITPKKEPGVKNVSSLLLRNRLRNLRIPAPLDLPIGAILGDFGRTIALQKNGGGLNFVDVTLRESSERGGTAGEDKLQPEGNVLFGI